ncbi:MAG: branched-chain amino acid ABC transporter permease [Chloroflexi bacterium]|nr:branched-chain amino acid ABC transporter permease [Chloroflexota bacterium]
MFLQQVVNGIMLGSMYSLVAIGYTLVFGLLSLLNLAHGDVFMIGAFFGLFLLMALGLPLWAAFVGSLVLAGVLGLVVELLCFRRVKPEYHFAPALSTVALGMVIVEMTRRVWGTQPLSIPKTVEAVNFSIGGLLISSIQLLIFGIAIVLMICLELLLQRTRIGSALRAVAEHVTTAKLLGVNVSRTIIFAFFVSSALAGIAGLLLALRLGVADQNVGLSYGLKALAVMVIGGLGNVRGAMVCGIIAGVAEVLAQAYTSAAIANLAVWAILIVVLIFRPQGLFGTRLQTERA